jgi:methylglutaconyl-CoA hydratase
MRELLAALEAVESNAKVRIVVLTGAGSSFCAGGDIAHMRSMLDLSEQQNIDDARVLARCLRRLDELDRPLIVRVNGNAFGGGVGMVACADIAIAASSARFALTEVRLGLVPAVISPYVMAAIGARQARRLFLTAAAFDGVEAQQVGLIHYVEAPAAVDRRVEEQIALLLRAGPAAARAAKQLVRAVSYHTDRDLLEDETARLLARLRVSAEGREGLAAFLERRDPDWIG